MTTTNISIVVSSPPSTRLTYTPSAASFTAPVPAGTVMGTFAVAPAGWAGTISLSEADAAIFALNTQLQLTSVAPLAARTYNVTATSAP